jgi:hypothetical protein
MLGAQDAGEVAIALVFNVKLSDVNGTFDIIAPENAKPFEEMGGM